MKGLLGLEQIRYPLQLRKSWQFMVKGLHHLGVGRLENDLVRLELLDNRVGKFHRTSLTS